MIEIRKATMEDIPGIIRVCSEGYRVTYQKLLPPYHIEKMIHDSYTTERIQKEIIETNDQWNGWYVALDNAIVVGASGGGFISEGIAALYVFFLDPNRKRQGIGSRLLQVITEDQKNRGAHEQWVSVAKNNQMAIPFYEAVGFQFISEQTASHLQDEEGYISLQYMRKI